MLNSRLINQEVLSKSLRVLQLTEPHVDGGKHAETPNSRGSPRTVNQTLDVDEILWWGSRDVTWHKLPCEGSTSAKFWFCPWQEAYKFGGCPEHPRRALVPSGCEDVPCWSSTVRLSGTRRAFTIVRFCLRLK